MRKKILSIAVLFGAIATGYSQVGIGTHTPNASAQLEIVSSDKGVLIPRVSLRNATDATTISTGNVNSLLVFNTNTALGEGYYYWLTDKWLRIVNSEDIELFTGDNTVNVALSVGQSDQKLTLEDSEGNKVEVPLSELFKGQEFVNAITETHFNAIFNNQTVIDKIIENLKGDFGNVVYDQVNNKFQYYNTDGALVDIDWTQVIGANTTNVKLEVTPTGDLKLVDSAGNAVNVALKAIFDHADFVTAVTETHAIEIFNNENVIDAIIDNLKDKFGNVKYNSSTNTFEYINDKGEIVLIDWSDLDTTNERLEIVNNELVLTDSKEGVVKVPLAAIAQQPWQVQGGIMGATSNTQDIYQMGKVAIGSNDMPTLVIGSAAQDVQLHVEGNISTTGKIYTTNSVYADYVFEKYFNGYSDLNEAYEFKSLDYVKRFIAANNHLPGVTKISDLEKTSKGYAFDMTQLSIQQLEKIEELYLHTIEQRDLIERQQAEIEYLKSEFDLLKEKWALVENWFHQQTK